jgi:hypothetical protein
MLELRTNERFTVLSTELSTTLDELREFSRCMFELFRTCCEIEEIEPCTTADLG